MSYPTQLYEPCGGCGRPAWYEDLLCEGCASMTCPYCGATDKRWVAADGSVTHYECRDCGGRYST